MMKVLDCSTLCLPFLCRELGYMPSPFAQSISCLEDGRPIAGVVYDGYNTASITAHIWIAPGKRPSREWFAAIFDYPFVRLGVKKIVGQVCSANAKARELDEHLGFVHEATIKDFSPEGDLMLYSMTKDQCRVLTSSLWACTVENVQRRAA